MDFEVYIDSSLSALERLNDGYDHSNKNIMALLNDFEDAEWRYAKFQHFIWDNIAQTALSFNEREALSFKHHTELVEAAKNLRLTDSDRDIGTGSELAEVALYGLMKHHHGALPVVPKIFYKQNTQDNAKGADSVHIVLDQNGSDFSIWFGEAKFYNSLENDRLRQLVTSVGNALKTDKLKKENSIITNLSDFRTLLGETELAESIMSALSTRESIDQLKPRIHVPIFVLHECEITAEATSLTTAYREMMREQHEDRMREYFHQQNSKLQNLIQYSDITFHLVLFPVPNKSRIIDRFIATARHYRSGD